MMLLKSSLLIGLVVLALAGCSADDSVSPVASVAVDTSPPAIPTGLASAPGIRVVKLAWDPDTTTADFQGFLVYRLAFGNAYLLTPAPNREARFMDRAPLDIPCAYAVSSVDQTGNESAWVEVRHIPQPPAPDVEIAR